ncbi:pentapeptide repeat-containing protein, partial [Vineibacter terrae]|uniref:pentapeptide repeat-containing protein n=1 Tax=Vineibacter terrae TaxID=2586908 RepID=UPI002E3739E2
MTAVLASLLVLALAPARAADLTREEVVRKLAAATPAAPADFSGRSLEKLDLSDLDLSLATFTNANMRAVKLDSARLRGARLAGANLNLAWVMRADFTGADLAGASVQGLVVAPGLEFSAAHAPLFAGASFAGARVIARFGHLDLRGADFSGARMAADMRNQSMGLMRMD